MIELRFQSHSAPYCVSRILDGDHLHKRAQAWLDLQLVIWAVESNHGNQTRAAKLLGINFGTFRAKLRKHKVKVQNGKVVSK